MSDRAGQWLRDVTGTNRADLTRPCADGDDNTSIGLKNVLARIRLNFGGKAQMEITSEPQKYTRDGDPAAMEGGKSR